MADGTGAPTAQMTQQLRGQAAIAGAGALTQQGGNGCSVTPTWS